MLENAFLYIYLVITMHQCGSFFKGLQAVLVLDSEVSFAQWVNLGGEQKTSEEQPATRRSAFRESHAIW